MQLSQSAKRVMPYVEIFCVLWASSPYSCRSQILAIIRQWQKRGGRWNGNTELIDAASLNTVLSVQCSFQRKENGKYLAQLYVEHSVLRLAASMSLTFDFLSPLESMVGYNIFSFHPPTTQ